MLEWGDRIEAWGFESKLKGVSQPWGQDPTAAANTQKGLPEIIDRYCIKIQFDIIFFFFF